MPQYTAEKNVQILLSLLKQYNIKKIVASPGTTNITFIASAQSDPFFEIYSSVDERSAAYIACGLSASSGEAVVLSCTGATASRNYMPGLTEAFYRKLPILAVTSTQPISRVGLHYAQMIDRSVAPNDVVKKSFVIPLVKAQSDVLFCTLKINEALHELFSNGCIPVHINLETRYTKDFSIKSLPPVQKIQKVSVFDEFPTLPSGKIGIFISSHKKWSSDETLLIDSFCEEHNSVVFCDHTSGYKGKYRVLSALITTQNLINKDLFKFDLIIYLGEISGDYDTIGKLRSKEVWRVNSDGIIRNPFGKITYIFAMPEICFFRKYISENKRSQTLLLNLFRKEYNKLLELIPDVPFSNLWIAQQLSQKLPNNSNLYLGILNTLRSWNFFEVDKSIDVYSNVGGFGIDGLMSSLLGLSLVNTKRISIGIVGDLGFFYDMNVLGNRHVGKNFRILLINNGVGTEFKNYNHFAANFGDSADSFIAARGHYGNQSELLVKHYAEDLGFTYLSAKNKKEFFDCVGSFIVEETDKPILFEVFTNSDDESTALKLLKSVNGVSQKQTKAKTKIKNALNKLRKLF